MIARPNHEDTFCDFYLLQNDFCTSGFWVDRVSSETGYYNAFYDYVENQIDNGYTLEASFARCYFSFVKAYPEISYISSTCAYGYNREKEEIYISGFFSNNLFLGQI